MVNIEKTEVTAMPINEIAEYNPIEAGIARLREQYGNLTFDCSSPEGNKSARSARYELSRLNGQLESVHKAVKAPALERCRLIDEIRRRIAGEIEMLRAPIDEAIKAEELRVAKVEADRVAGIQKRIYTALSLGNRLTASSSARAIEEALVMAQEFHPGDELEEFQKAAIEQRAARVAELTGLLAERQAMDAEAARLSAEREELARKQAEDAARIAEHLAKLEAERREHARIAEEQRKAQEAQLAEERRRQEELIEAERARMRAEEDAARKRREEEDRAARERHAEEARRLEAERAAVIKEREKQIAERERLYNHAPLMLSALVATKLDPAWLSLSEQTRDKIQDAILKANN